MQMAASANQLYARADDIVAADVAGEVVLLSTKSWSYFEFDRVGTSIWTLLDVPRSLPSLVEALTSDFDVDEALCRSETKAFLAKMIAEGLVTLIDE